MSKKLETLAREVGIEGDAPDTRNNARYSAADVAELVKAAQQTKEALSDLWQLLERHDPTWYHAWHNNRAHMAAVEMNVALKKFESAT